MIRVLASIIVLAFAVGCPAPQQVNQVHFPVSNDLSYIRIGTPTSWILQIDPDGSGGIVHGAGDHSVNCPPHTFNFAKVRKRLALTMFDGGDMVNDYCVTFWPVGATEMPASYSDDEALISELFRIAKSYSQAADDIDKIWKAQPPTPIQRNENGVTTHYR